MLRVHEDEDEGGAPLILRYIRHFARLGVITDRLVEEYGPLLEGVPSFDTPMRDGRLVALMGVPCLCVIHVKRRDTIEWIWVCRDYRGKGYGAHLMRLLCIRYAILDFYDKSNITSFFIKHDVRIIYHVRLAARVIVDTEKHHIGPYINDNDAKSDDSVSMEESDEDEETVRCDALDRLVLYKTWLMATCMGISDVAMVIGLALRRLYCVYIEFRPISEKYYCSVGGVMSTRRLLAQQGKFEIAEEARYDRKNGTLIAYYGQFVRGFDHIVRSKTMCVRVTRERQRLEARDDESGSVWIPLRDRYGMKIHTEPVTRNDIPYHWLNILMETGVNRDAAIQFARTLDLGNTHGEEAPRSTYQYAHEYCRDCWHRACLFNINGVHGCECSHTRCNGTDQQRACDCDCHLPCSIVQK